MRSCRETGYKIYDRYKDYGVHGLIDRRRRPYRHANQLPLVMETQIVQLKRDYPDWGAPKIREKLRGRCGPMRCPIGTPLATQHAECPVVCRLQGGISARHASVLLTPHDHTRRQSVSAHL